MNFQGPRKELLSLEADHLSKSDKGHSVNGILVEETEENPDDDLLSDQVPTLSIHEKLSLRTGSGRLSSKKTVAPNDPTELQEISNMSDQDEVVINGVAGSPESKRKNLAGKHGRKGTSSSVENKLFGFSQKNQNNSIQKVILSYSFFPHFNCLDFEYHLL